jgi:hypothetical protein
MVEVVANVSGEGGFGAAVQAASAPVEPLVSPMEAASPTPPEYTIGWVKQSTDDMSVAVRTNILDPDGSKDWGVMTIDRGGHYASWDEVQNWQDMT